MSDGKSTRAEDEANKAWFLRQERFEGESPDHMLGIIDDIKCAISNLEDAEKLLSSSAWRALSNLRRCIDRLP